MFESSEGNTQNAKNEPGPGALCSLAVCARCQGLVFCLEPDSWPRAEPNAASGQPAPTTLRLTAFGPVKRKQAGTEGLMQYLALNGNLCRPQWELDLILCLLECFGVGYGSKWIFFFFSVPHFWSTPPPVSKMHSS